MSGPTTAFADLDAVQVAYDEGDVQSGDVVYVVDVASFIAVIQEPARPVPTYIQPTYGSQEEIDDADLPAFTPAVIWSGVPSDPIEPVVVGGCGSLSLSAGFLPSAPSIRTAPAIPLSRVGNENITTNYSAAALPTVDDVP